MTMIWRRKKSIQLVLSAWKTTSRFITCNRAMICQGQRLAVELGHNWVSLLLSPTIVQHLMSSLSEQIYVGLKKTCLGLPAPSLTGSSTLYPPLLPPWPTCVSRLCRTTVCTRVSAHTVPFACRSLLYRFHLVSTSSSFTIQVQPPLLRAAFLTTHWKNPPHPSLDLWCTLNWLLS